MPVTNDLDIGLAGIVNNQGERVISHGKVPKLATGYAPGCLHIDTAAGRVYRNDGTSSSSDFAETGRVTQRSILVAASDAHADAAIAAQYSCDGTADEVQINAAIAYALANGYGIVQLSSGTFTVSSPILVGSGITLRGDGWYLSGSGTKIILAAGADCNVLEPIGGGSTSYFHIEDLHLDGNETNQTATSYGIADTVARPFGPDFKIINCLINHCRDGCVLLTNTPTIRHFVVRDTTLEYTTTAGTYCLKVVVSDDAGHKLIFSNIDIDQTGSNPAIYLEGFNAAGRGHCSITGCVINTGAVDLKDCNGFNIAGNYINQFSATLCDNLALSGNHVERTAIFDNCDVVAIAGNTILQKLEFNNSDASANSNVTITGNALAYYVDLDTVKDFTYVGNSSLNYLQLRHCVRGVIANNVLGYGASTTYAIYMNSDDSDYLTITNNERRQTDGGLSTLTLGTSGTNLIVIDPHDNELHLLKGNLYIAEKSADPTAPPEGECVIWMSDGTGKGDDGDVLIASTAGGATKYATLFDHSGGSAW